MRLALDQFNMLTQFTRHFVFCMMTSFVSQFQTKALVQRIAKGTKLQESSIFMELKLGKRDARVSQPADDLLPSLVTRGEYVLLS